mgnify:CR=1 FL=1
MLAASSGATEDAWLSGTALRGHEVTERTKCGHFAAQTLYTRVHTQSLDIVALARIRADSRPAR